MNIPYKYEEKLLLGDKSCYPDFTLLIKSERKEIYWEHFGMIDNPEYCSRMLDKLEVYASEGITLGNNLIITFESSAHPLSTNQIEKIIQNLITR